MGEPRVPPRSRREGAELRVIGVDVDHDATVPDHPDEAPLVDVVDDAAIAGTEAGGSVGVGHELDSRSDRDARLDAGREETCAGGVHDGVIGFDLADLDPLSQKYFRGRRHSATSEGAVRRRTAPKSTAEDWSAGRRSETPGR